jgi:hypothetical protein
MAKKRKFTSQPPEPPAAPAAPEPAGEQFDFAEVWQHPTLFLAGVSAACAVISVVLAFRFHDDMSAGALREPTGMILWTAIAVTLFASYWRERNRERTKSGS